MLQHIHESFSRIPLFHKIIVPTVVIGIILSSVRITAEGWHLLCTKLDSQFAWAPHQVRRAVSFSLAFLTILICNIAPEGCHIYEGRARQCQINAK